MSRVWMVAQLRSWLSNCWWQLLPRWRPQCVSVACGVGAEGDLHLSHSLAPWRWQHQELRSGDQLVLGAEPPPAPALRAPHAGLCQGVPWYPHSATGSASLVLLLSGELSSRLEKVILE